MSFPSPSLVVPVLNPYQFSYNGLTFGGFGATDPYHFKGAEGLYDQAQIVSGDTKRPLDQGEFAGVDAAGGRDPVIQVAVRSDGTSFDHARQVLSGALRVKGSTEKPLWFQLPSGLYATMARPRKFACPVDELAVQLEAAVATVALHCTDSRIYKAPSLQVACGIPNPGEHGEVTVENTGSEGTRPVLVIEGPCKNPKVLAHSIPGEPWLEFTLSLVAGDVLEVDTDWETVLLTHAGVTSDVSNSLKEGSTWFELEPKELVVIRFSSADLVKVAAQLKVQYASALVGA